MVKFDDTKGVIWSVNLRRTDNTMVKFDDTKGVIWSVNLRRTDNTMVKFDDTKGVIRSRKSKKDKQHNGQVWRYQRGNLKP